MDKITQVLMTSIERPKEGVRMSIDADAIRELAESIKEKGLLQPVLLRKSGSKYEVVAGDRRFLAHEMLGKKKISAIVREMDETECFSLRALENLQREDLSPIEEGVIYQTMRVKYNMSINKIAKTLGKSFATITQRLKMLELPDFVQQAVHEHRIAVRSAEELLKIGEESVRDMYLRSAIENGASVKTCLLWVNEYRRGIEEKEQSAQEREITERGFAEKIDYGTCEVCHKPYERGKMRVLVVCPDCLKIVTTA